MMYSLYFISTFHSFRCGHLFDQFWSNRVYRPWFYMVKFFWGSSLSDCSTCLCAEEDKTVLLDVIQTGFQIQPSWSWLVYWTKPVVLLKVRLTRMVYAFHIDSKPVYNTNEIVLSIFTSIFFEQQGCRLANTHFRLESSKLRVVSFTYCIFALDCVTK